MSPVGYGVSPWGTGYWGDGNAEISTGSDGVAYAVGNRVVRVNLAVEPLHVSTSGTGDALNPRTWKIQNLATGQVWTLMAVKMLTDTSYEILTLEPLPKHFTELELSTVGLRDVIQTPFSSMEFLFNGCYLASENTPETALASKGITQTDLFNALTAPLTDGAGNSYSEMVSGTLVVDSAGNYEMQSGADLVRKLILRRLIAKPGDFFHLPNYGLGLRVKEPLPVSDLRKLAAAIEEQVNQEPEVQASKASLSYSASASALIVRLKVQLRPDGQIADIPLVVPTGAIAL